MLKSLPKTELLYPSPKPIDELNLLDAFHLMLNDQSMALQALEKSSLSIINTVNEVYLHLSKKSLGRIIYCGAGTSGRIAVQDGVELYPTFGWPKKRIKFLIAGGNKAILNSVENAEDNINEARVKVDRLSINKNDIVIGLAASGNTAFTNEVLKLSNEKKILTIAISNNPRGSILKNAKLNIEYSIETSHFFR